MQRTEFLMLTMEFVAIFHYKNRFDLKSQTYTKVGRSSQGEIFWEDFFYTPFQFFYKTTSLIQLCIIVQ